MLYVAALATGCKSIAFSELRPEGKLANKFPALEPQVDVFSLEKTYSSVAYGVNVSLEKRVVSVSDLNPQIYRDPKIQDAIILFDREVSDNIANGTENGEGYIIFRILSGGPKKGGNLFGFIGMATLWIPNLLGVPTGNHKAEFEVELEILDDERNLIGKYHGYGKHKTWIRVAGYNAKDAQRLANIRALKKAFLQIKEKLDANYKQITEGLTK